MRPFSSAKTGIQGYIKPTKRDFDPSFYILHIATNDLSPEALSKRIIANVESLKKEHNEVAISNIVQNIREFINNLSFSN